MQKVYTASPGASIQEASLPNGSLIRGISVDNPSGSWLFVKSEMVFIPPYTLGWALALSYAQTSVSVVAGPGPAGQTSTSAGDPWNLTVVTEPLSPSQGVPTPGKNDIIPTAQSSNFAFNGLTAIAANHTDIFNLVPGVAGKSVRLLTLSLSYYLFVRDAPLMMSIDSGSLGGSIGYALTIGGVYKASDTVVFPSELGVMTTVGNGLSVIVTSAWSGVNYCWYGTAIYV